MIFPPGHLKAADRLAIQDAVESLVQGGDEEAEDNEALALANTVVALDYGSEISDSEDACKQLIGDQLWSKLSSETQRYITRGHLYYLKELALPGETGDFASSFLQLSNGLQKEIYERFVRRVFLPPQQNLWASSG